jgi:hypothetical protein
VLEQLGLERAETELAMALSLDGSTASISEPHRLW